MLRIDGYIDFERLCDEDEFILYRCRQHATDLPMLAMVPRSDAAGAPGFIALARSFALRDALNANWAVVPVALGSARDRPVLFCDDPGGMPLSQVLARHGDDPLPLALGLTLAAGLARAVAGMHASGLVHCALHPAHIMAEPASGKVRLSGFGHAISLAGQGERPLTQALGAPGIPSATAPVPDMPQAPRYEGFDTRDTRDTHSLLPTHLAYIAPEQTGRTNHRIDERADLYSLGVILYRLLTGKLPFHAGDAGEWIYCHLARAPARPMRGDEALPPVLCALLDKLLAKTPAERYQSAASLATDLWRCLQTLREGGNSASLPATLPGGSEGTRRLPHSRHLHGRAAEQRLLRATFDRVVQQGTPELVLIGAYSGSGKSTLVFDLLDTLGSQRLLFLRGKFDPLRREVPYATLAQAIGQFVQQVVSESEETVQHWRTRLNAAFGGNGRLLIELAPELERLVGPQPALPAVPPAEAQNRFRTTLRAFLGALASSERPLVLFLDDLQWVDDASCKSLLSLLSDDPVPYLLILGAFRDHEVDDDHPLMQTVAQLYAAGVAVQIIPLAAFSRVSVQALIADVLRCEDCPDTELAPLAALVHQKTGGNPFFVLQFLDTLIDEGLLHAEPGTARWQWNIARIRDKNFTDNVAELMVRKLRRLPQRALVPLRLLACLGHSAELSTLAHLQGGTPEATLADLRGPLRAGLIVCEGETVRFVHDRVREAAYSLIPPDAQPQVHLDIARALLATLPEARIEDNLFALLDLFNRGVTLLDSAEERQRLRALNARAARRAKLAVAYRAALSYLTQAIALLEAEAWLHNYSEAFELHLEQAECAFLVGAFDESQRIFEVLLRYAQSRHDHARVDARRLNLYQLIGDHGGAIAVAEDGLARFGVLLPKEDSALETTFERLHIEILTQLADRPIASLLDAPIATDPDALMMLQLLGEALPSAFDARPQLATVMIVEAIRLSLRYGNAAASCFAYSCYARWLISQRGDIPAGHGFSEIALRLSERFADPRQRGRQQFVHGAYIQFWREPISVARVQLEYGLATCTATGDLAFAGYTVRHLLWQIIEQGAPLDEVAGAARRFMSFARQSHNEVVYRSLQPCLALVDALVGHAATHAAGNEANGAAGAEPFDADACLAVMTDADFGPGIALFHVRAQVGAAILGDHQTALTAAQAATAFLPHAMSTPLEATHHFYRALSAAALAQPETPNPFAIGALQAAITRYELWARHSPVNFQHRLDLLRAESARLHRDVQQAMRYFAAALDSARAGGFIHEEALTAERAALFYDHLGIAKIAALYRHDARSAYRRWGAIRKLQQLETLETGYDEGYAIGYTKALPGKDTDVAQFDLVSALKASHAVSQELVLDRLVANLLHIAMQHAGADRGLLVLMRDSQWQIEAQAVCEGEQIQVDFTRRPPGPMLLPQSVLHYVSRMREPVLLDDASLAPTRSARLAADPIAPAVAADPYVLAERPRSLLCLPLLKQTRLVGALYLENKLAAGVFTRARIALLELLASQAAISLENATLFQALQEENRERQRIEAELKQYGEQLEGLVAARTAELEGKHEELAKAYLALDDQAVRDPLTGLHNRRFLMRCIATDISRSLSAYHESARLSQSSEATTPGTPSTPGSADLLFLLLDIDHFKQINDTHGHTCGDAVLIETAQRVRRLIRESDYVVRWGGEEFLVVCRNADRATLNTLAERLRCELSDQPYVSANGAVLRISCSVGATAFPLIPDAPDACDWERAIDLADRALYAAKLSGRNGWVVLTGRAGATRQALLDGVRNNTLAAWQDGLIDVHTSLGDAMGLRWNPAH